MPVINNTLCEAMYRTAGYVEHIPHIFICAGWRKGGYDSCEGKMGSLTVKYIRNYSKNAFVSHFASIQVTLVVQWSFNATTNDFYWPESSVGVLDAPNQISRVFTRESPSFASGSIRYCNSSQKLSHRLS